MNHPAIEVEKLSLQIGQSVILQDVSLQIPSGQWVAIIGQNGAGKSSLIKCIMNIARATGGNIRVCGESTDAMGQRALSRKMSYVPQATESRLQFTAFEFVLLGRYPFLGRFATHGPQDIDAVNQAMAMTNVSHLEKRKMGSLSGGERQNVYIAAALAQGAEILLLDEPTAYLDPGQKGSVFKVLENLRVQTSKTIVLVTHDINAAVSGPERVIALKKGQLVFDGTGDKLMEVGALQQIFDAPFTIGMHPKTSCRFVLPEVCG